MWVVKLGGSLAEDSSLQEWLRTLAEYGRGRVVIVPGGGRFADQIRMMQQCWKFNDRIAHSMALLSMHQIGLLFLGLEPRLELCRTQEIPAALRRWKAAVWLPQIAELDQDGVPASWAVTSDSLAAWLAGKIAAKRLVLVKSKVSTTQDPILLRNAGIVDAAFPDWLPATVEFNCYHRNEFERFGRELCAVTV